MSSDLSANALTEFPNAVFASSQLDNFRIASNGFEIAAMSTAQYDFLLVYQTSRPDSRMCLRARLGRWFTCKEKEYAAWMSQQLKTQRS